MANNKEQKSAEQVSVSQTKRRGFLKKTVEASAIVAGAAALPSSWKKPVIDAVIIPSHAQTGSDGSACPPGGNPFTPGC